MSTGGPISMESTSAQSDIRFCGPYGRRLNDGSGGIPDMNTRGPISMESTLAESDIRLCGYCGTSVDDGGGGIPFTHHPLVILPLLRNCSTVRVHDVTVSLVMRGETATITDIIRELYMAGHYRL